MTICLRMMPSEGGETQFPSLNFSPFSSPFSPGIFTSLSSSLFLQTSITLYLRQYFPFYSLTRLLLSPFLRPFPTPYNFGLYWFLLYFHNLHILRFGCTLLPWNPTLLTPNSSCPSSLRSLPVPCGSLMASAPPPDVLTVPQMTTPKTRRRMHLPKLLRART